ncbi:MAG: phage tail family protein [bacterium]|nr:phage tail family protein [bacterium]
MGNFSFAGEHSASYYVRLLKSSVSMLPGTRDKVIVMPGRHGALRMLPDLGERTLQLECWLEAASMAQLQERLERIRAWLNPLRGAQQLVFDNTPDKYYKATFAGGGLDAEVTARQGAFSITLVATDPFAYAVSPDVVTLTASPHQHTQRGTAPADPLLRVQGILTGTGGQQISLAIGAQVVTYRGALASGNWLEIDCAAKTAERVVGQSRTRVLHLLERPVFPQLAPGANTITISASGGAVWSQLQMHGRNRWL